MGLAIAVCSTLLFSLGAEAAGSAPPTDAPIRLLAATFYPQRGEVPSLPNDLRADPVHPGEDGYYIVQFTGPVLTEWRRGIEDLGAEPLAYIPDFAFKTRMTPEQAAAVARQPGVAWVGPFHPAYRIAPGTLTGGPGLFRIRIETGADTDGAVAAALGSGAVPVQGRGRVILVAASTAQIRAIAHVLDVAWIERFTIPETHNEQGGGVIMGGSVAQGLGFDGSTQTVAVADTGLGNGTAAGAHPDIPQSRVVAIHDWPSPDGPSCWDAFPDGAKDPDSGHGTHTSVSAVGDGGPGGEGRGVAPAADLVFQAIEDYVVMKGLCAFSFDDGYYLLGLPEDLQDLYQQAYDDGARIHSNSWGSDAAGDYTLDSANTDLFVFLHPTFVVTFSAGNAGADDSPANGVVDSGSVGSPATAKNVITVGASEGARPDNFPCDTGLAYSSDDPYQSGTCTDQGGHNTLGTGSRWEEFTVPPLSTDVTAGNAEQMAPFSSRGPADDGRIKPDVVAPGTWILSGYSNQYQEGYGGSVNPANLFYQWDGWGIPFNQYYKYMGGTSMSNPLVAGGAAVVADFYVKTDAHTPSAALVKATLVNTARDLLDENNDGVNDNDFPIPNPHEGWGIVDLANATDGSHQYVDNGAGLQTSGSAAFAYAVEAGGSPLRVTLAWSDAPSTEAAVANLVNDLDLVVTAPNGTTTYVGNVFSGGWSQTTTSYDRVNNLENVYVAAATSGTWTVTVQGYNVPSGTQPFALVVDGDLVPEVIDEDPPVISNVPDDVVAEATGPAGAAVSYPAPTANDLVDGPVTVNCVPASGSTFSIGGTTVNCTATDNSANEATAAFGVTVHDTTPPAFSNVPDDITTEATGPDGAAVTYTAPTASDVVNGAVSVNCVPASGSTFPIGITPVNCTATDNSANQATATFDVSVFNGLADTVGLVDPGAGLWYLRDEVGVVTSFYYGVPGDLPFVGDWDCDGLDTPGLYRQSDGFVYLRNTNSFGVADITFFFGLPGDLPIAGDFDEDGCDSLGIYRPSEGRVYISDTLGSDGGFFVADYNYYFGLPGDKPFVGDFDGDGIDTIGLHRESTGFVYFRNSHTQGIADNSFFFGIPNDRLVAGDWGIVDGMDTPAVFRPSTTTFYFRHTNTQGNADSQFVWGSSTWLPIAGNFGL